MRLSQLDKTYSQLGPSGHPGASRRLAAPWPVAADARRVGGWTCWQPVPMAAVACLGGGRCPGAVLAGQAAVDEVCVD
jgi:hypothetical protein